MLQSAMASNTKTRCTKTTGFFLRMEPLINRKKFDTALMPISTKLSQIPVERRTPPPSSDVNVRGFTEENLEFMNHQSRQAHFVPALGNVVLQTNKTYMVFFLTCMNRRPVQFLKIRISNQ